MRIRFISPLLLFLFSLSALAGKVYLTTAVQLETRYDDNVLQLSEYHLREFGNNTNPDRYRIESSDDYISTARLELALKHYLLGGHTQRLNFRVEYDHYWRNSFMNCCSFGFSLTQYLNRQLSFQMGYSYDPDKYSDRFLSVLDTSGEYHDFTYDRNRYYAEIDWRPLPRIDLGYELDYSRLFFNEYFTEYDAALVTHNLRVKWDAMEYITVGMRYSYNTAAADAADAFPDPTAISLIKDATHQDDVYLFWWKCDLSPILKTELSLYNGFKYSEVYFQTENRDDTYHYSRRDCVKELHNYAELPLGNGITARVFLLSSWRSTSSVFPDVERDKEYNNLQTGIRFYYRFEN
ncbi:MAG: hypothetical protein JXB60_01590 [Candidatus Cloacimonetes bacterium]|nr:hypothetical protein [Candidatus Cloacimonadota bacterium]